MHVSITQHHSIGRAFTDRTNQQLGYHIVVSILNFNHLQRKTHSLILINLVFAIGVFILAIKLLNRSKSYYNIVESTYIIVFSAITEQSVSFNCLPEGSVFLALIYNSTILIIYLTGFHLSNVECKIKSTSLSYLNVSCSFIKIYCLTS